MSALSGHRHSVPKQVMVNLFIQASMEIGMPWLKKQNEVLYQKLGWLAQNQSSQLQVAIGGAASAAEVMFDALPILKDNVKGVIDEILETLGGSTVQYFKGRDLGLPKDYKVEGGLSGLVSEFFTALADAFKASAGKVQELFKFKLPSGAAKVRGSNSLTHLAALSERDMTKSKVLVRRWLKAIAGLPKNLQDDLRRIDPELCVPGVIEGLLKMTDEERNQAIEKMAKNTLEEELGEGVSIATSLVRPVVHGFRDWLERRKQLHEAARRSAAPTTPSTTPPATPTATP